MIAILGLMLLLMSYNLFAESICDQIKPLEGEKEKHIEELKKLRQERNKKLGEFATADAQVLKYLTRLFWCELEREFHESGKVLIQAELVCYNCGIKMSEETIKEIEKKILELGKELEEAKE